MKHHFIFILRTPVSHSLSLSHTIHSFHYNITHPPQSKDSFAQSLWWRAHLYPSIMLSLFPLCLFTGALQITSFAYKGVIVLCVRKMWHSLFQNDVDYNERKFLASFDHLLTLMSFFSGTQKEIFWIICTGCSFPFSYKKKGQILKGHTKEPYSGSYHFCTEFHVFWS